MLLVLELKPGSLLILYLHIFYNKWSLQEANFSGCYCLPLIAYFCINIIEDLPTLGEKVRWGKEDKNGKEMSISSLVGMVNVVKRAEHHILPCLQKEDPGHILSCLWVSLNIFYSFLIFVPIGSIVKWASPL